MYAVNESNQAILNQCEKTEVVFLDVEKIAPNPYQPRRTFPKDGIEELSNSIKEYGVMQPITVRTIKNSNYELVSGERRLRASKLAGLTEIPAIIVRISDKDSAILALIENLQRENLNFFDEAEGLKNLIDDYNFTQEEIAQKVGKNQSTVANKIRVLKLPAEVRRVIVDNGLSERHARALLKLPMEDVQLLLTVIKKVIDEGLTVKATEKLVDLMVNKADKKDDKPTGQKVKTYIRDMGILKNTIKQAVGFMQEAGINTEYDIEEREDGCFISIMVSY